MTELISCINIGNVISIPASIYRFVSERYFLAQFEICLPHHINKCICFDPDIRRELYGKTKCFLIFYHYIVYSHLRLFVFFSSLACFLVCIVDLGNIVISGGGSLFNNLASRLTNEMREIIPASSSCKIIASPDRRMNTWIGGTNNV
jgi:hypothetical protein